jgi:type IV pilus assembly protein PilO
MVSRSPRWKFDLPLNELPDRVAEQFKGLDPARPGQWPLLPKLAAWLGVAVATLAVAWALVLSSEGQALQAEREREPGLKQDYQSKLSQAVNLAELRRQKLQVQEYVSQLEKQLPGKAEMDALLSDINQAGIGRGLQFELFKPGQVEVKDYYAELPIAIRLTGRYHDIGAFAADVANLPRIVTLHNVSVTPTSGRDSAGLLVMEATARTYRYLDPTEVAEMKRVAQERAKAVRK